MTGMPITRLSDQKRPGQAAEQTKNHDGQEHDQEQEAGPAAGVLGPMATYPLDRKRIAGLVGVDRHVLGAVIGEDPPDLRATPQQPQIAEEDAELDNPFQGGVEERAIVGEEACRGGRGDDEEPGEEDEGDDDRAGDLALAQLLLFLTCRFLRRPGQSAKTESQRFAQNQHAPDERHSWPISRTRR